MATRRSLAALTAVLALAPAFTLAPVSAAWAQDSPPPAASVSSSSWRWRAATGGQVRSRPAVGHDGTVYALSEDSYLYAWAPGGSLRWKHDLGWIPWDCLAVSDDGSVYAGLKNGDFLAVNPRGGRLWTVRLDGPPAGDPAVAADGTVMVGTSTGALVAISHLGQREWSVTLPAAVAGPPALDGDGTIYLAAADRRLYSLTPWGEFSWSLPLPGAPGAPAIGADGSVVVGTDAGWIVDVTASGDVKWKAGIGAPVAGLAAGARQVVACGTDGRVVSFSMDGREQWRAAGKPAAAGPFLGGPGVLVPALDGSMQGFDAAKGAPLAARPGAPGAPVMGDDGTILVGGRDWVVYALEAGRETDPSPGGPSGVAAGIPAGAPAGASWPQAGHDPAHSGRSPARPPAAASLLANNPDYLYLQGLLGISGRDGVRTVLSELESRVDSVGLGKSRWYAARILEGIVGLGLVTQVRVNQKLVNDFPDLRAEAAGLLGRVGSASSRFALLQAVRSEKDGVALAAEIRSLGEISSDGDGASMRAIARAFNAGQGAGLDDRLAAATVEAVGRIALYEGGISERSAITALLAIATGAYDASTRAAANAILQGDLKAYILNREE